MHASCTTESQLIGSEPQQIEDLVLIVVQPRMCDSQLANQLTRDVQAARSQ